MQWLRFLAKISVISCSVAAGAAVSFFFLQDLLAPVRQPPAAVLGGYPLLFSDTLASLTAGILAGGLFHFCLWDCLASWLGRLIAKSQKPDQPAKQLEPAARMEQMG